MVVAILAGMPCEDVFIRGLAGGKRVAPRPGVVRSLFALALVSGCLIAEPINQRPSLDIERRDPSDVFRGDTVTLRAITVDPEEQHVHVQWRAYLCTTALLTLEACDQAPFYTGTLEEATFTVPMKRADMDVPVEQILVLLEGQDSYGATADPMQQLVITVNDHAPDVTMRKDSRYGYVVDVPLNVYASIGDVDDGKTDVELSWKVYTPMNQPAYDFEDLDVPDDVDHPERLQAGKRFTPKGVGDWDIELTATDAIARACLAAGGTDCGVTVEHVTITVVPDHAPCLAQWAPIAPPVGATFPMTAPTLFQVNVVQDDLDPYPGFPDDAVLDTTKFTWSLLPPGGSSRQEFGTTNHASLDPSNYAPGDILELRVEIADRKALPITCAPASPTCSVISDNACLQRLTWRVEVR